ncbi:Uncharacterized protein BP5553_07989 [Venustampulla echinocandica]|uniref:RanBD1 domain-containing protein n=1 Tax=Venustampulla echinocandica TaxID=2656787 RepID=A0A370TFG8_9HELO|nr:Uncharacterized protein BP5553_07989 [Venustampulla echinocandica]RDL33621.1 Uncharacterized protein BP5553_07989 [Venustampulla echinocandica]
MSSIASEEATLSRASTSDQTQPDPRDTDVIKSNHDLPARTSAEEGRSAAKEDPATMAASEELKHTTISDRVMPTSLREPQPQGVEGDSTAEDKDMEGAVKKRTPEIDATIIQDEEMRERISSPKKKRGRDQDDDTKDLAGSALDKPGSAADGNTVNGSRTTRLEPEKKRPRDASEDKVTATDSSDTKKQSSTNSEMSNKRAASPQKSAFGGPLGNKSQTSATAFASSGFASLAASSTSPFGSLGASKPSIFGGGSQPTTSGFGALAGAKSSSANTDAPIGGTTASTQKSAPKLGFGGGATSGFSGLGSGTGSVFGSGLGNGFSGGSGPKLSSFAAPGKESIVLGAKPAKAFGAPESEEESDGSDSEAASGTDDEEGSNVIADDKKKTKITKVHVDNGESGEATLLQLRAKLFRLESKEVGWKERGVGTLKVNVPKACASFDNNGRPIPGSFDISGLEEEPEDPTAPRVPRLIMRQENTHRVILNTAIFKAMRFEDKPSTNAAQMIFTAFEGTTEPKHTSMLVKMSEANAKLFRSEIQSIQREL